MKTTIIIVIVLAVLTVGNILAGKVYDPIGLAQRKIAGYIAKPFSLGLVAVFPCANSAKITWEKEAITNAVLSGRQIKTPRTI